jgi:large subunit ribosomal protein L33
MQCTSCSDLNYRTEVRVAGGVPKLELKKYCRRERKRTVHKLKRK